MQVYSDKLLKKTKFSEDGVETLIKNTKQFEKVGKYLKLEKIETINYLSKNYHYLFDIYYQYKYKKTTHKIKINLTYNLISKKLEIKMTSEKNDNFWIKIKEFFINKYMLMIFNFLIKKYKNNTKKNGDLLWNIKELKVLKIMALKKHF